MFFGIEKERGGPDRWDECERKVGSVIRNGLGITEDIAIERAHRTGKRNAILVKLLSFKHKELILKNARKLKDSEILDDVFVREDFSLEIRKIRRGLRNKAKELFDKGQKARINYDKLITNEGVYTFDTDKGEVIRMKQRGRGERDEATHDVSVNSKVHTLEGEGDEATEREGTERQAAWDHDVFDYPQVTSPSLSKPS